MSRTSIYNHKILSILFVRLLSELSPYSLAARTGGHFASGHLIKGDMTWWDAVDMETISEDAVL